MGRPSGVDLGLRDFKGDGLGFYGFRVLGFEGLGFRAQGLELWV